jgi:hypothetical protein
VVGDSPVVPETTEAVVSVVSEVRRDGLSGVEVQ